MGAFFLIRRNGQSDISATRAAIEHEFDTQGFKVSGVVDEPAFLLVLYGKQNDPALNLYRDQCSNEGGGTFVASTGTVLVDGQVGESALRRVADRVSAFRAREREPIGSYCLISGDENNVWLSTDSIGTYKLYKDKSGTIWSSSFVAVATAVPSRSLCKQAVYEYIFQGTTYGEDTLFNEVLQADAGKVYRLTADNVQEIECPLPDFNTSRRDFNSLVEENSAVLRDIFDCITKAVPDQIETALSAGIDSRLMLGLLQENDIAPRVHVYGKADDTDVSVAKQIAAAENFELHHVDKSVRGEVSLEEFPGIVKEVFGFFDGFPLEGILGDGSDLADRRKRTTAGALSLNGGGGEIYRNPFYLPDRKFSARNLIWSFFSQYDPDTTSGEFSLEEYESALEGKILAVLKKTDPLLDRVEIEYLFPAFRCRHWMAKNNSINNRLGKSITPFLTRDSVAAALGIPMRYKYAGRLEGRILHLVAPRLASYPSQYGHNFSGMPPRRRIFSDWKSRMRPTSVRRLTFRIKTRLRPDSRPYYLSRPYLEQVLDVGFPLVSCFLQPDKLANNGQFNRACTVEYLACYFSATC